MANSFFILLLNHQHQLKEAIKKITSPENGGPTPSNILTHTIVLVCVLLFLYWTTKPDEGARSYKEKLVWAFVICFIVVLSLFESFFPSPQTQRLIKEAQELDSLQKERFKAIEKTEKTKLTKRQRDIQKLVNGVTLDTIKH
jgi:hypothetical protein